MYKLLFLLFVSFNVSASSFKLGVIDTERLQKESKEISRLIKEHEDKMSPKKDALLEKKNDIDKKSEELGKNGATLKKSEKEKLEDDIAKLQAEFRKLDEDASDFYRKDAAELHNKINKIAGDAIRKTSRLNDVSLMIPRQYSLYASDAVDYTDKALKNLEENKKK